MHFLFLRTLSVTQLTEGRVEQQEEEPALNSPSNQIKSNQNGKKKFFRLSCEGNEKMYNNKGTGRAFLGERLQAGLLHFPSY